MSLFRLRSKGFSLLEILIVIAVIGILAAVILTTINASKKKGRDTQRISDLTQVQTALRVYRDAESEGYPEFDNGDRIGDAAGMDPLITSYLNGTIVDPRNTGRYRYYYDSNYTCNGESRVVLVALRMENSTAGNYTTVCGNAAEAIVSGAVPDARTYIVILN